MPRQKKQNASESSGGQTTPGESESRSSGSASKDAVTLLREDHRKVEGLFEQYESASAATQKSALARQVCQELIVHTMLEEEIFYPACRSAGVESQELDEAQVEHDGAKVLINDLLQHSPSESFYDAKVKVLSEYIKHHVREEEQPSEGIFARARSAGVDLNALGGRIEARKAQLKQLAQKSALPHPQTRSFELRPHEQSQETSMSRQYERDRDEQGRYSSEYSGRGQDPRGGRGWYGDSQGHSRAAEYRGEGRYSSRDERQQDEDYYRRSQGGSGRGWYGDPEAHSRASERGWEQRGHERSGRDEGDDYRRSEGRSEGSGRGWYGDPEGNSRASERGWEQRGYERGGRDEGDDYRRFEGSGRGWEHRGYERGGHDEEENGRTRRSHGGWFGDSEGHSEAARRRS